MKGDFSRYTFRAKKHYSGVLMQQGRVNVDADWNEQQAIHQHRVETEARDVIGGCGTSTENDGFALTLSGGKVGIGKGRYYVDGILCENDTDGVTYDMQPSLPNPPDILQALKDNNTTLALLYLDIWKRHVTALDDSIIKESALGGPDTSTRIQTVWQVKALPVALTQALQDMLKQYPNKVAASILCSTDFSEWDALSPASSSTMNARTKPVPDQTPLCDVPPTAGYQLLENQLYRVEVHQGGSDTQGTPTFKWSRENGSVVTLIENISGNQVTVHDLGPDEVLGFDNNQWVEITDDEHDLKGLPGELLQISSIEPGTRIITMKTAPVTFTTFTAGTHLKLRRWDQSGTSATAQGVPMTFDWQPLEGGIEVNFARGVTYKTGEYWLIPARTATGEIEWPPYEVPNTQPEAQPALGIQHHFCRIGFVLLNTQTGQIQVHDCRETFVPLVQDAVHVINTNWGNDDYFPLAQLESDGLQLTFDAELLFSSLTAASFIVTLELPLFVALQGVGQTFLAAGAGTAGGPQLFGPMVSFILDGDIIIASHTVTWKWKQDDPKLFQSIFTVLQERKLNARLRVTLKGHMIWSHQQSYTQAGPYYLDGQAFGQLDKRADGTSRTALSLPSGGHARASDFESWCYLTTQTLLHVTELSYIAHTGNARGNLYFPPPPDPNKPFFIPELGGDARLQQLRFTLTFNNSIDAKSINAGGKQNIYLLLQGKHLPVKVAAATSTTIVLITGELHLGEYQLVVLGDPATDGSGATPLTAQDGTPLDGDYDNKPGGNFAVPFVIKAS